MSSEDIIAIIKWGPLLFFLLVFLFGMIRGMIKGRRKVLKRLLYVIIFVTTMFFLTPTLAEILLNFEVGGTSIEGIIRNFIEENESIQQLFINVPGLKPLIDGYLTGFVSLFLFVLIVLVGLPLSFPIYWIYSIIFGIFSKFVFKYSKYKKDENGKFIRNEKGKKIKDKKNKHRLSAGLIKGGEAVALSSVILAPVGVVTRVYSEAKETSVHNDLSKIEYLKDYEGILEYIDVFNDSFIGKATNSKLNEIVSGYLTEIEVENEKSTIEKELKDVVVAAIYLEESGLIQLLSKGIDINTLDLSCLKTDKLELAINALFNSLTLKSIINDGVNYVLENNLKETLVNLTKDEMIVDKVKYNSSTEVKKELLSVIGVLKEVINTRLLEHYQTNNGNVVGVINEVNESDVEKLLNKILTIRILSKAMPGVVENLLKDYGLTSHLQENNNSEFVTLLLDVVKLVKTFELTSLEDITEGNILENLITTLYKDGAIKSNSRDALATLLSNITSSLVFDEVLVTQLNKILNQYEITLNSQMIINVKSKEDWNKELNVLENIIDMYDLYSKEKKVDFLVASELIDNLKETKALILALPIAYQTLFPELGIEVDLDKIKYIDYDDPNVSEEEREFYSYWENELVHLEKVSEELAKLKIESLADISLDLLDIDANIVSLSNIIEQVFTSDLLGRDVEIILNSMVSDLLSGYGVILNEGAISGVNNVVNTNPYYIVIGEDEYEVLYDEEKYYIGNEEVVIENGKVNYNSGKHSLNTNSLSRVWGSELTNLSNIINAIKLGDYTNRENLTIILNSVDDMALLKNVKNDLLFYAVEQLNIIDMNKVNKDNVSFGKEKEILLNIIDKYDLLKDISNIEFKTISNDTITDLSFVLNNVLESDIFGDYAAESIVAIASSSKITLTKENVKKANTWENDLKLIRSALNMNNDSFNKTTIETLLNDIEDSSLLYPVKEELLLTTARTIKIDGITISTSLTASDINYSNEKNAILIAADSLDLLKQLTNTDEKLDIKNVDTEKLGSLLNATMKSKMFSDSVVTSLVEVLKSSGIKHDNTEADLITSIRSVTDWNGEIELIKSLLDVKDEKGISESLFDNIYNSKLLNGCRATLMVKMVDTIIESSSELNLKPVTVEELKDDGYSLYDREKSLLLKISSVDNLNNLDNINRSNENDIVEILNLMKGSVIFENKYDELVTSIAEPIKNNSKLSEWGLTTVIGDVNNWKTEIDALLTVKENAEIVSSYTSTNYNSDVIVVTLDAIDRSSLLSGSDSAATAIVRKITGNESIVVSKGQNDSWADVLEGIL